MLENVNGFIFTRCIKKHKKPTQNISTSSNATTPLRQSTDESFFISTFLTKKSKTFHQNTSNTTLPFFCTQPTKQDKQEDINCRNKNTNKENIRNKKSKNYSNPFTGKNINKEESGAKNIKKLKNINKDKYGDKNKNSDKESNPFTNPLNDYTITDNNFTTNFNLNKTNFASEKKPSFIFEFVSNKNNKFVFKEKLKDLSKDSKGVGKEISRKVSNKKDDLQTNKALTNTPTNRLSNTLTSTFTNPSKFYERLDSDENRNEKILKILSWGTKYLREKEGENEYGDKLMGLFKGSVVFKENNSFLGNSCLILEEIETEIKEIENDIFRWKNIYEEVFVENVRGISVKGEGVNDSKDIHKQEGFNDSEYIHKQEGFNDSKDIDKQEGVNDSKDSNKQEGVNYSIDNYNITLSNIPNPFLTLNQCINSNSIFYKNMKEKLDRLLLIKKVVFNILNNNKNIAEELLKSILSYVCVDRGVDILLLLRAFSRLQ